MRSLVTIIGMALLISGPAAHSQTQGAPAAPATPVAPKPDVKVPEKPAPTGQPVSAWTNAGTTPMPVDVSEPPEDPVFLQLGHNGQPYRVLKPQARLKGVHIEVPAGTTVQMWSRADLATASNNAFTTAARWGAFPEIVVGPIITSPGFTPKTPLEAFAWRVGAGRYRAYPEGEVPVMVRVRNSGIGAMRRPRIRLFAPDDWTVTPEVAEVVSPLRRDNKPDAPSISVGPEGNLPPSASGTATFLVRIPKREPLGSTFPLVAFMRFETGGGTLTVQNSVDVTLQEPIERRYAMNEAGSRFWVRLINRFAPLPLGAPGVEVRSPTGANWEVTPPKPVAVAGDVDAVAPVKISPPGDASIAVPVVVTLNGLRMGATPVVYTTAAFGAPGADGKPAASENGVKLMGAADAPMEITADGACAPAGTTAPAFSLEVAEKFAVSDPTQFVSPSWVTVTFTNRSATRLRLEYDAYGSDEPAVAADRPLTPETGETGPTTLTFLLPDARFQGRLPGGADLRLSFLGGGACLRKVTVSKWNPEKTAGAS